MEINSIKYDIGRLSPLKQFHLVRRIVPLLAKSSEGIAALQSGAAQSSGDLAKMILPMVDELARMPDEEAEYIIFTCLSVVRRDSGGSGWSPVLTRENTLMFEDIGMEAMLKLVAEVVKVNLSGFFAGLGGQIESPKS